MSAPASFDIRLPIGGLFTVLGLILGGYGLATLGDTARYAVSLGVNINLWWGLVMLVFGALLLAGASRTRRAASAQSTSPPGGRSSSG